MLARQNTCKRVSKFLFTVQIRKTQHDFASEFFKPASVHLNSATQKYTKIKHDLKNMVDRYAILSEEPSSNLNLEPSQTNNDILDNLFDKHIGHACKNARADET